MGTFPFSDATCTPGHSSETQCSLLQGNYTGYMHLSCALKEATEQGVQLLPPVSHCKAANFSPCSLSHIFGKIDCHLPQIILQLRVGYLLLPSATHGIVLCRCVNIGGDEGTACIKTSAFIGIPKLLCPRSWLLRTPGEPGLNAG